jgi:HCOMODA/2-hydroxy-3-carboxy-muconic semialdehyde decarboxylase
MNADLTQQLVIANRILFARGIVDAFGHVSVRADADADAFLLSCNRAPGLVGPEDIALYGLDGEPLQALAHRPYLERFIHSEIYRARRDVLAVVHSHSWNVVCVGITGRRFRPVMHMAGFLLSGAKHFDLRKVTGDSDLLIRNATLGQALAQTLADSSCVLMRGHGCTVVGASLKQAVYRAVYAEANAQLLVAATPLGDIEFLTDGEAALSSRTMDSQVTRAWELWAQALSETSRFSTHQTEETHK